MAWEMYKQFATPIICDILESQKVKVYYLMKKLLEK